MRNSDLRRASGDISRKKVKIWSGSLEAIVSAQRFRVRRDTAQRATFMAPASK